MKSNIVSSYNGMNLVKGSEKDINTLKEKEMLLTGDKGIPEAIYIKKGDKIKKNKVVKNNKSKVKISRPTNPILKDENTLVVRLYTTFHTKKNRRKELVSNVDNNHNIHINYSGLTSTKFLLCIPPVFRGNYIYIDKAHKVIPIEKNSIMCLDYFGNIIDYKKYKYIYISNTHTYFTKLSDSLDVYCKGKISNIDDSIDYACSYLNEKIRFKRKREKCFSYKKYCTVVDNKITMGLRGAKEFQDNIISRLGGNLDCPITQLSYHKKLMYNGSTGFITNSSLIQLLRNTINNRTDENSEYYIRLIYYKKEERLYNPKRDKLINNMYIDIIDIV